MGDNSVKPFPEIREAFGTTLFRRGGGDSITVTVKIWEGAVVRQRYYLWLSGTNVDEESSVYELVYTDFVLKSDIEKGVVEVSVAKSKFEKISSKWKFGFVIGVDFDGGGEASATKFSGRSLRWVDDIQKDVTTFANDDMNGWKLGPTVKPTEITFEAHDGKRCLQYRVAGQHPSKTIIYKDFELIVGKRYSFSAMYSPSNEGPPRKNVVLYLSEGKRSTGYAFYDQMRLINTELGITARTAITRLELCVRASAAVSTVRFSDLLLYEFVPEVLWDPEWDIEWPSPEDVTLSE